MHTLLPARQYQNVLFAEGIEESLENKKWQMCQRRESCQTKLLSQTWVFFCPIERGRSLLKRYGVLFTHLLSCAVYLEVAHSLDTNSCISAIQRFISRRGMVSTFRSDNGTNFIGAKREPKQSLAALNHAKIQGALIQDCIWWNFNTPAASHQDGIWERLICSVRSVLTSVLKQ